jgi:uncharacterized metal-binding protein
MPAHQNVVRVRPLPVLYACRGCEAHGQVARHVADGCAESCAARWLEQRGFEAIARDLP